MENENMNNKIYSINELSEMFDISKQALYKKKKSDNTLAPFWTTVNNVLYLDQNGFNILKNKLPIVKNEEYDKFNEVEQQEVNEEQKLNDENNILNVDLLISSYKSHIDDLRLQLDSKDKHINNLNETIATQSELLKNMQILLRESKDNLKRIDSSKKSILTKLFKR